MFTLSARALLPEHRQKKLCVQTQKTNVPNDPKRVLCATFQLYSDRSKTGVVANDGKWHHICLVWTSQGGRVYFYNEKSKIKLRGFSNRKKIPGKESSNISDILLKQLRRNPPGLRVVIGQNYVPKLVTPYCKFFLLLLQISYQKKSFLTTPNIENRFRSPAKFH